MSTFALSRPELFPIGAKVHAFILPALKPGELARQQVLGGSPATFTPPLAPAAAEPEQTVDANGKLEYPTLVTGTEYLLWAEVGGVSKYLRITGS